MAAIRGPWGDDTVGDLVDAWARELRPYIPGRPVEELERELGIRGALKLASNENPLGPSPRAQEAMRAAVATVHQYPESGAPALTAALAAHWGVDPATIVLGNGSDEIIGLLLSLCCREGEAMATSDQAFLMYRVFAQGRRVRTVSAPLGEAYRYDLDALARVVRAEEARIVFLANPSNPTGTVFSEGELARFAEEIGPDPVLVLDEAYFEYVTSETYPDGLRWVRDRLRTVVLRTFSKAYGLAGIRVGYGIMDPTLAGYLHRLRFPFNVNRVAQAGAVAALGDAPFLEQVRRVNAEGMAALAAGFDALGLPWVPSQANFLLVRTPGPAKPVVDALQQRGVIVRPMDAYGFGDHFRVTVGLPEENARMLAALGEVLAA